MLYPVYVHPGDDHHAHGITIPDFPGCFSATDDWNSIPAAVQEAIEVYCEGEDLTIPQPSSIERLLNDPDYQGGVWLMADIDLGKLSGKTVRINITVPELTLQQIDRAAKKAGVSRSKFMTDASSQRAG